MIPACTADARKAAAATTWPAVLVWGAGLAVAALRLLFSSRYLYHWDSVNFALGMHHYDVRLGQPHVPGYILYVAAAWLVNAVVGDANRAMVLLSALGSGLLTIVCWRLAERLYPRTTHAGPIAALLVAGNPLLWFYGGVALPHVPDAALGTFIVLLLWRIRQGEEKRLLLPAALLLGIAAGVRQQNLMFLLPLGAYCLVRARVPMRRVAMAGIVVTGICALWAGPLITLSGGLDAYRQTVSAFTQTFSPLPRFCMGRGWTASPSTWTGLWRYTLYAVAFPLLAVLATLFLRAGSHRARTGRSAVMRLRSRRKRPARRRDSWCSGWPRHCCFIRSSTWGKHGLIFTFLPGLLLLAAGRLDQAGRPGRWGAALAALAGALVFTFAPERLPIADGHVKLLNAAMLRNLDHVFGRDLQAATRFPAAQTVILSPYVHHLGYYLPESRVFWSGSWGEARPGADAGGGTDGTLAAERLSQTGGRYLRCYHRTMTNQSMTEPLIAPADGEPEARQMVLLGPTPRVRIVGHPVQRTPPRNPPGDAATTLRRDARDGWRVRVVDLPPGARVVWSSRDQEIQVIPAATDGSPPASHEARAGMR
jgi:hypothetical protein